ncbi:MAG TPA: hypothetical protein VNL14_09495 [Candidatus Acidoferrales bacterium]|nr:hypothetical protein [Candidatus Acidoferrales bacterium]
MPEQISKYPEVTLEVLKSAGAVCGQGAPQKILKQCPAKQFCSLPAGEICVYGIDQIPQMTQITLEELARVVARKQSSLEDLPVMGPAGALIVGAVFAAGFALGKFRRKTAPGQPAR